MANMLEKACWPSCRQDVDNVSDVAPVRGHRHTTSRVKMDDDTLQDPGVASFSRSMKEIKPRRDRTTHHRTDGSQGYVVGGLVLSKWKPQMYRSSIISTNSIPRTKPYPKRDRDIIMRLIQFEGLDSP